MKKRRTRSQRQKIVAIWLILSLVLSLLVGALSIRPTPAGAAESVQNSKQRLHNELVDTDQDGIENNADSDVDGDGIINGEDDDIDGDGISNFDDADPIDTTDIDSNAPEKPIRPAGAGDGFFQKTAWIWISLAMVAASILAVVISAKNRRK